MIKIVPDANVIISGMISPTGAPRKIINLAYAKKIILYGSEETYKEFCRIIKKERFDKYLKKQYFSSDKIILDYRSFMNMINPFDVLKDEIIVVRDQVDDEYFKVAIASNSQIIISRDKDLLEIKKYSDINILSPGKFLKSWRNLNNGELF